MLQQINLYTFLPKKPWFTFTKRMIIVSYSLFLGLLFCNYSLQLWHKHKLNIVLNRATLECTLAQQKIIDLSKQYPSLDLKDLTKSVQKLQDAVNAQAKIIGFLSENGDFSNYLTAIANAAVPGAWLTEMSFSTSAQRINLRGSALQPAMAEQFLDRLLHEPVFAGISLQLQDITQSDSSKGNVVTFFITNKPGNSA